MRVVSSSVRGIEAKEKRRSIKDLLVGAECDVVLSQETKVMQPSSRFLKALGGSRIDECCCLDAVARRWDGYCLGFSEVLSQKVH